MVYEVFKHSSSDLNLNLVFLVDKFTSWFPMKHLHFLARPGPVFHLSASSADTDMFLKFFNSLSTLLHCAFNFSLANSASA